MFVGVGGRVSNFVRSGPMTSSLSIIGYSRITLYSCYTPVIPSWGHKSSPAHNDI